MHHLVRLDGPIESDGRVSFFWAGRQTEVTANIAVRRGWALELRLGYPEAGKNVVVDGKCIAGGHHEFQIRKGWHSYFVPLADSLRLSCLIIIDESLVAPGDSRFLGAMLSYCAVTDDKERIRRSNDAEEQIATAARRRDHEDLAAWVADLHASVLNDQDGFYTERVLSPGGDALEDPLWQYSVEQKRERWIAQHVTPGSSVLELGCGLGGLGALARRGVHLVGLDLSLANCLTARARGYAAAVKGDGATLPFADEAFDYVVSADVLGHVPTPAKPRLLQEMHRVLKPGGEVLHLIETDDFDPAVMAPEDYARMVLIDGHVGIQRREQTERAFAEWFDLVSSRLVGNCFMSADHWVRAHDLYGDNLPGPLANLLLNATEQQRAFFNLGVGWTFWRTMDDGLDSPGTGGLLFLWARKRPSHKPV